MTKRNIPPQGRYFYSSFFIADLLCHKLSGYEVYLDRMKTKIEVSKAGKPALVSLLFEKDKVSIRHPGSPSALAWVLVWMAHPIFLGFMLFALTYLFPKIMFTLIFGFYGFLFLLPLPLLHWYHLPRLQHRAEAARVANLIVGFIDEHNRPHGL